MVQPVLRTVTGQGVPHRISYPHDPIVLHSDGAQRSILECMGHHPKGMERLLKEDHLRINCRHHRLDYLKLLATTYITKKEPRVFHNARGLFTKLNYLNQKFL